MITRLITAGVMLLLAGGCTSGLKVGAEAPPFEATTFAGDTVSLADYKGQVLILDFFGVW